MKEKVCTNISAYGAHFTTYLYFELYYIIYITIFYMLHSVELMFMKEKVYENTSTYGAYFTTYLYFVCFIQINLL